MKLLEIALKGFGRFRDAQFRFHPQINVIFGPNEAGKSTLQQAIVALLYGFYDNKRALPRERESHERYRPWPSSLSNRGATNLENDQHVDPGPTRALEQTDFPIPIIHAAPELDTSFISGEANLSTGVLPQEEVMTVIGRPLPTTSPRYDTASLSRQHYSGSLKYALDDGRTLLIHRDFSSDDVPTQLLDAVTGEDWLIHYHRGRHGKVDFMEKQIGMSRQVFLATACLRQGALQLTERDASAVSEAILRLLDSAGADQSAEQAIERLEKKLRELGSDRAQNALLPQARRRLEELRETQALRLAAQRAAQEDIENVEVLEMELEELRQTLAALEHHHLRTQLSLLQTRFRRWQENEQQRASWAEERVALEPYRNFPIAHKETFFQLWHDYTHFDKLRAMLLHEREEIELKLMALAEKSKPLQVPEQTWTKFSFEDFLALRSRWDSLFQEILNNEGARLDAEQALKKAGIDEAERAAFASLDWQHLEEYKILEARVKETEAAMRTVRDEYNDYQIDMQRRRRIAALAAFVALVALATGLINNLIGNDNPAGLNLLLLLSVLGMGVFIFFNIRWVARSRELSAKLLQAEDRYMEERPQLIDLLSRYRVNSVGELLQRRLQFVELGTVIQAHLQLTQEMSKIEQDLAPWMNELGIGHIAPETLQDAEKRLRESHQQWSEKNNARQRLIHIEKQQQEIQQTLRRLSDELEKILQEAGINEPVGEKAFQLFSTGCQRREYLETLHIQFQQAEALGKEILAGETPD
ncbi:MAG: ATP-binding protein, partial [candidate division KSB1 bacterium]|nr:ATP-binding protein [candidate division KSB1 bacterium]